MSQTTIGVHLVMANNIKPESWLNDDCHEHARAFRAFYGYLHDCDARGAALIVVEALPPGGEWDGIRDRLLRASAG